MRSRILFFALLLCIAGAFVMPHVAFAAAIPYFGPIVPKASADCPAGWGMLVTVINNIITVLLSILIVFFAPIMIAYAGFLYVVNPVNASGKEKAKQILTNTIVGIIISLSAWMIVAAIMAVLYHPDSKSGWGETWQNLISGGSADGCLEQSAPTAPSVPSTPTQPPITVVPQTCKISPLSPIEDRLALQMENGQKVVWENTNSRLRKCAEKYVDKLIEMGEKKAYISSAYRPQAYQKHLFEVHDRWCIKGLKSSDNRACQQLKSDVWRHVAEHGLSKCGTVSDTVSSHTSSAGSIGSTGVDISGVVNHANFKTLASTNYCLEWKNYDGDPYHYDLKTSCTCQ